MSLAERMEDFVPLVVTERDGVEVLVPVAEFLASQAQGNA